jgi:hypothetical protein
MISLKFFRKRQKLIFIIMVALMVSFLIGFQGFSMLLRKDPGKQPIGKAGDFEVTVNALKNAQFDVDILRAFVMGFGYQSEMFSAYRTILAGVDNSQDASISYALLLHEAQEGGFTVTEAEVNQLVADMESRGFPYKDTISSLRQNRNLPEKEIRGVFARWLTVFKSYRAISVIIPPSSRKLRQLYRDVNEKIDLRLVTIPAETFVKKVPAATEKDRKQIEELFEANKNRAAGTFAGTDEFSFGYLLPPQAAIDYIFINHLAIQRVTIPGFEEIQDYYNDHKDEFLREVPAKKDAKKAKDNKDKDKKVKKVQMTIVEARPAIIQKLKPEMVREKFQDIVGKIQSKVRQLDEAAKAKNAAGEPLNVYQQAVTEMTFSAEPLLKRKIPIVAIEKKPLSEAIDMLAELVSPKLSAICFPYGRHDKVKIDPELKVTLMGRNMTLATALEKIAAQIPDMPKLKWAAFEGIDGCVFPVEGIRFFPATAGRTKPASAKQLGENPLLAGAFLPGPNFRVRPIPLLAMVMHNKRTNPAAKLDVGQEGPPVVVMGDDRSGQLLWKLRDANPPKAPELPPLPKNLSKVTDPTWKKVIDDWKLTRAFELSVAKAKTIKTPAEMDAYIKSAKAKPVDTGMFARKVRFAYGVGAFQPTQIRAIPLAGPAVNQYFIEKMFDELAPKDLKADYPKESKRVASLPLKCQGYVVLARRINYRPALEAGFAAEENSLMRSLENEQKRMMLFEWFAPSKIKERAGFAWTKP